MNCNRNLSCEFSSHNRCTRVKLQNVCTKHAYMYACVSATINHSLDLFCLLQSIGLIKMYLKKKRERRGKKKIIGLCH